MAKQTGIEWCDSTINFWIGCQEVSPACDHCYARVQNERRKWVNGWGAHGERRRTAGSTWHQLRTWNRRAERERRRLRVFCNSLSDFFDNAVDYTWRREAWHFIEQSPWLDFLILTKRPQNIARMLPDPETGVKPWGDGWPNVWLGTTAEDALHYRQRWGHLAAIPGAIRFLSYEPALDDIGDLDLGRVGAPNWVICGGESGSGARPMEEAWARSVRDQCTAAGAAFFMKQMGGSGRDKRDRLEDLPEDLRIRDWPNAEVGR